MAPEMMKPTAQKPSTKATYLARALAGIISDRTACATGASPPTPTPIRKRNIISEATLQAPAVAKLAKPPLL